MQKEVIPLLMHWSQVSFAYGHRNNWTHCGSALPTKWYHKTLQSLVQLMVCCLSSRPLPETMVVYHPWNRTEFRICLYQGGHLIQAMYCMLLRYTSWHWLCKTVYTTKKYSMAQFFIKIPSNQNRNFNYWDKGHSSDHLSLQSYVYNENA